MASIKEQGRQAKAAGVPRFLNPWRDEEKRAEWFKGYDNED